MNENDARALIERFAKKQRDRHFACPLCGKMTMDAECVTRNALSRRTEIYVCDACGTQEAIEDMMGSYGPLTVWAIAAAPEKWRMMEKNNGHKREEELLFYMECWRELQSFLSEAVRDNTGEYPFAADVLNLMRSIERKYEQ